MTMRRSLHVAAAIALVVGLRCPASAQNLPDRPMVVVSGAKPPQGNSQPVLRYVGSSTIANFIRDAMPAYGKVRFILDTEPESAGGEAAIMEGRADLAGVAGHPNPETLQKGVVATLIGRDAIAVVVNRANPVTGLTQSQLKDIFTGKVDNWKLLGGPNLPIRPFIVGPASATRAIFRSAVLGPDDYTGCEAVRPDADVIAKVGAEPGGIGHISFSFLPAGGRVKTCAVEGQQPIPTNHGYPIARPLYVLWWSGRARVAEFISWTSTPEARAILLKRFALAPGMKRHGESREPR